jgi:Kef-type K+ transport system membrane component KefB
VNLTRDLDALAAITVASALAPLVAALIRPRTPQVVFLLIGGIIIGPHVIGMADNADIELLSNIGLGFLFLLAGYELDPGLFRHRAGTLAIVEWVIELGIPTVVVGALAASGFVHALVPVALALATTALGTLLPILHDGAALSRQERAWCLPPPWLYRQAPCPLLGRRVRVRLARTRQTSPNRVVMKRRGSAPTAACCT